MKFNITKKYYKTLNEVLSHDIRKKIINDNMKQLDKLYYTFKYNGNNNNLCNFYIFNEIIDKDIFNIDMIDILINVNKDLFEDFVDKNLIDNVKESINIYFLVEEEYYHYDVLWKNIKLKTEQMININHYIEDYEI